jgi:hypothetical protein
MPLAQAEDSYMQAPFANTNPGVGAVAIQGRHRFLGYSAGRWTLRKIIGMILQRFVVK